MTRSALLSLFAATMVAPAFAQLSVYTVQNGVETPLGQVYQVGPVAVGSVSNTVFRLRNPGSQLYYLTLLSIAGTDFSNPDRPVLPAPIAAGAYLDLTIQFQPDQAGSYSATFGANDTSAIIMAQGIAGLSLLLNNQPVPVGQTLNIGSVQTGASQKLKLALANQTKVALAVAQIAVQGSAFQISGSPLSGTTVAPGASVELDLIFTPMAAGAQQGALTIGAWSFPLTGTGTAPPPPKLPHPSLQVSLPSTASAQQGNLQVNLDAPAAADAAGTVTLAFQSAVPGVADDPTVSFPDGSRSVSFSVALGATTGQFAGGPSYQFGTGTTAGTLQFTIKLGDNTAQSSVVIPAAAIGIDAAVAMRDVACIPAYLSCSTTNVELEINGWDNTRSTSQVVFRFFNKSGTEIAPGDIPESVAQAFQTYFAGSVMGGVFGLHALFPINGDGIQVTAAEVLITNSIGTTQSVQIQF